MTGDPQPLEGATPLDADEMEGLIPDLQFQQELNSWETANINDATTWVRSRRSFDPLQIADLEELHRRMFSSTWSWAGSLRRSEKNVSPVRWTDVRLQLQQHLDNTRTQLDAAKSAEAIDGTAMRYHHRLVLIHPWSNGNGRHARLATDELLRRNGRPMFSWGAVRPPESHVDVRSRYLRALRAADAGDYRLLEAFVRS